MAWTIEYTATATKELRKLDRQQAQRILRWLDKHLATSDNPRAFGKALKGELGGLWRYRVGDYRITADLQDDVLTVLVVRIGHCGKVYC